MASVRLDGKTAIVTGGTKGIGRATVLALLSAGASVVTAARHADLAERLHQDAARLGGRLTFVQGDVSRWDDCQRIAAAALETHGKIDILVNNAAHRSKAEFFEMTVEQWDKMHEVCTRGTFLCSREAIKRMKAAGKGGSIVNISSMSAAHTNLWGINYHYDSAKRGVDALTQGLAGEFAADNIRINSVQPGGMKSEGGANISASFNIRGPVAGPGRIPMGRISDPIEVAHAVLFLASPAASYITGQLLAAEGGFLVA